MNCIQPNEIFGESALLPVWTLKDTLSREGRSTTISLFLPRTLKVPPRADDQPAADEVPTMHSGHVLLVEDDDKVAALTEEMIKQLGYHTTRVASADAAWSALGDRRPVGIEPFREARNAY